MGEVLGEGRRTLFDGAVGPVQPLFPKGGAPILSEDNVPVIFRLVVPRVAVQ